MKLQSVSSSDVDNNLFTSANLEMAVVHSLILIVLFNLSIISGYNLGIKNPFLLRYDSASYFGYSIILHETAMIVSAPRDNFSIRGTFELPQEPGAVWHYILESNEWKKFQPSISVEEGFVKKHQLDARIMKEKGWFGASMTLMGDNDILTVCAPRTMITLNARFNPRLHHSMHGVCYNGKISSPSGEFQIYDPDFSTYDFSQDSWAHPICGFSIQYSPPRIGQTMNDSQWIMGCPKHSYAGSVKIGDHGKSLFLSNTSDEMQFGYAVTSGRFFSRDKLLYVGGGPRWDYIGQVGIIDPGENRDDRGNIISRLYGTSIGEYFGASLTVGDMNNDGLDDLIIGAPYHGNDIGRVYVYFGNAQGFSEADLIMDGYSDDSLFGYSISCGDLDADGFDDLIVGAPYEGGGVIYVFNGGPENKQKTVKSSQRVAVPLSLQTFGFSLSKPVDIDANGFPDIGVGAYKSGHAVLLKSRPVVKTDLKVSTDPLTLDQNSTNFHITICVEHTERKAPAMKSFDLDLEIDGNFKRVHKTQMELTYIHGWNQSAVERRVCLNTTVHISENVEKNYFTPIDIVIIHKFGLLQKLPDQRIGECDLCPIEVKGASSKSAHFSVPFDLGCGVEKVCTAAIELNANFDGNKSAWIIGSDDIIYEVNIVNNGEPAYSTEIIVEIPEGISLRTNSLECKKQMDAAGSYKVTCAVANPLYIHVSRQLIFVFDMSRFNNGSANGTYLNFNVSAKTQSQNEGNQSVSTPLLLLSHIVTNVDGDANERNYYYTMDDETPNIHFQHSYSVEKSGATPIDKARLCIDVPTKYNDVNLIDLIAEPKVLISDEAYNCSVVDIPIEEEEDIIDSILTNNTDKKQTRKTRHTGELPQKIPPHLETESNNTDDDHSINLNCLSPNVSCGRITCEIVQLRSRQDTVALKLSFLIKLKSLVDIKRNNDVKYNVSFTTRGWMEVVEPFVELRQITKVRTVFHHVEKLKRISIWIIIGSVLLGLVVLFVIATILWMLGFFKRAKKDQMEASKSGNAAGNSTVIGSEAPIHPEAEANEKRISTEKN